MDEFLENESIFGHVKFTLIGEILQLLTYELLGFKK
jgi:hypothetical protein